MKKLQLPLQDEKIRTLKKDDWVLLEGELYTARDQAHKRLVELIKSGKTLPINLNGIIIYYTGPTPAPKGKIVGSIGPTTSSRMDPFTPILIDNGVKGFIGKGERSKEIEEYIKSNNCVYFTTPGGIGALLSSFVLSFELVCFEDLGPEAIYKLKVKNFPVKVEII